MSSMIPEHFTVQRPEQIATKAWGKRYLPGSYVVKCREKGQGGVFNRITGFEEYPKGVVCEVILDVIPHGEYVLMDIDGEESFVYCHWIFDVLRRVTPETLPQFEKHLEALSTPLHHIYNELWSTPLEVAAAYAKKYPTYPSEVVAILERMCSDVHNDDSSEEMSCDE
eukprot:TRINITY_DN28485_c0_g1_i1.p1 TRINITY_DN28485_c0_g1~~TRINITY_DN28485_c0_g1_i1.p1  ORF type:complete len:168 (+),score=35.42 TRINITY_DN28485_c0_g1_i1:51-554(+)